MEVIDNFLKCKELKEVEDELKQFNIFDCLGLNMVEIRHSYFLKWLLDPYENHGFKDKFLKIFFKKVLSTLSGELNNVKEYNVPSVNNIDEWDMTHTHVEREKNYIDLLIVDDNFKFVCIIENKISIGQHDNQLEVYRKYIDEIYNNKYKKLFLYLKPEKEEVEKPYFYISYKLIQDSLEELLKEELNINQEALMVIKNYKKLIERDIMGNKELEKKCAEIYKQHHEAIDYINKYCSPQKILCDTLENMLKQNEYINKKTLHREANSGLLCLPNQIQGNYIDNLKFADWEINENSFISIYFSLFKWKPKQIFAEILVAPMACNFIDANKRRNKILNKLKDKQFEFKETKDWIDIKPIPILEYDDYFKYDEQTINNKLIEKLEEIKNKLIIPLRDSINEVMQVEL